MKPIYHLTMQVDQPVADGGDFCARSMALMRDWVTTWYSRRNLLATWDGDGKILFGNVEAGAFNRYDRLPSGNKAWNLSWRHPDDKDSTLSWVIECAVASTAADAEFSITLALDATDFVVAPVRFDLGTPRIVRDIAREFSCRIGSSRVGIEPRTFDLAYVQAFVEYLRSPLRRLATVLISPLSYAGDFVIAPTTLAYELLGLADVWSADRESLFALTNVIGKSLSCYDGAVRVYYPGLASDSSPYYHPLYLPAELQRQAKLGRNFAPYLLRKLASDAASRSTGGPLMSKILPEQMEVLQRERRDLISRIQEQVRTDTRLGIAEEMDQLEEMAAEIEKQNTTLQNQNRDLQDQNARLADENEALKQSIKQIAVMPIDDGDFRAATPERLIDSVLIAVELASAEFPDQLVILRTAIESARESPYEQPQKVYEGLAALAEVTAEWQMAAAQKRGMGQSWVQALKERGFDWTPQLSETTRNRHGEKYSFIYEDKKQLFDEHITLGAGQPNTCLSIHVYRDKTRHKLVIGHVGRHLPNTTS